MGILKGSDDQRPVLHGMSGEIPEHPMQWLEELAGNYGKDHPLPLILCLQNNSTPETLFPALTDMHRRGFVFHSWDRVFTEDKGKWNFSLPFPDLFIQVEGEAILEKISAPQCDLFFNRLPREHQLMTWVQIEKRESDGMQELSKHVLKLDADFAGRNVPRPDRYRGYQLIPSCIRFNLAFRYGGRIRIAYSYEEENWRVTRRFF